MPTIYIREGDITKAQVDAIVNAANPSLLGGGGVDGAIHHAAGPQLVEVCRRIPKVNGMRCPFGEARITSAGALPSKYVIHAVGPIYNQVPTPEIVLAAAYKNALSLGIENGCRSIAFPAISCGVYGYPAQEAADIAMQVCSDIPHGDDIDIYFYLFGQPMYDLWLSIYQKKFG